MTATIGNRNTPRRAGFDTLTRDLAPATTINAGALVGQTSAGLAVPARAQVSITLLGCATHRASTEMAGTPTRVEVARGIFRYGNSGGGDAISIADYGRPAYCVDDQTVAKTNGGGTRPAAGTIRDVDAQGVWIEL